MTSLKRPIFHVPSACLLQFTESEVCEQTANTIDARTADKGQRLREFLISVLPDQVPNGTETQSKEQLIDDVFLGIMQSTMAVRIT